MTGIETAITTTVASQFTKFGWDVLSKNEFLNQEIHIGKPIQDILYHLYNQYATNYRERHGQVSVLRMSKAMDLESIYVNVQCLDDFARDYLIDAVNLEKRFRKTNERRFRYEFDKDKRKDGLSFANDTQYLMVFGGPGIGKSTFLRKVGLEALKGNRGNYRHQLIPVFLELKKFKESEINIQALIEKEFEICGFPDVQKNIDKKLKKGELLILFDGLDEVPDANRDNVIDKIQDFVDQHKQNRFILSCRTAARTTTFRRFTDIEVAEFDDEQIQTFIEHWFSSEVDQEAEIAKNCWELLTQSEYQSAKNLAHTPLLLTFLCLTYRRTLSFPTNRSSLYERALRIFLEEWSAEKQLTSHRNLVYEGLNIDLEEGLLAEIAYSNFVEDRLFLEKRELVKQIKTHLQQNLNAPQILDGEKVLKTIELEQGILVEQASDVYSFSHLTLQEYLTARYIVENDLYEEIVKNHLTETRWQEVFLLISGLLRGKINQLFKADHFLLAIEKESQEYAETPKLYKLLVWVDQATCELKETVKLCAKRSIIIFDRFNKSIELTKKTNDIEANIYNNYIDNTPQFYEPFLKKLDKLGQEYLGIDVLYQENYGGFAYVEQIPKEATVKYINKLTNSITKSLLGQSEFDKISNFYKQVILEFYRQNPISFFDWRESDWIIFQNYLYVNELILNCKKAAQTISPSVWEEIEDRMLRVL